MSVLLLRSNSNLPSILIADLNTIMYKLLELGESLSHSVYQMSPDDLVVFRRVSDEYARNAVFRLTPYCNLQQIVRDPIPDKYVYKLSEVMTTFLLNGIDYEKLV